jgi:hypothetical protein
VSVAAHASIKSFGTFVTKAFAWLHSTPAITILVALAALGTKIRTASIPQTVFIVSFSKAIAIARL